MKKPDEIELMRAVLEKATEKIASRVTDCPSVSHIPDKRICGLLEKWDRNGWWEYGVSLDCGWLTENGRTALKETVAKYEGG